MHPTNYQCVWYRHPGSAFYILADSVSSPQLYVQPCFYNQSLASTYLLQRVIVDEVEKIENGYHADVKCHDSIAEVGTVESAKGTGDGLKSCEEEEAIPNGDLDTLLYSPMSICSSLSDRTEPIAKNLDRVGHEFGGDIDADESSEVAVKNGTIAKDRLVDGAVVQDNLPVDLQVKVNREIGIEQMDLRSCSSVQRIQAKPAVRRSLRFLQKSKVGRDIARTLVEPPKKKWIKQWMAQSRRRCS